MAIAASLYDVGIITDEEDSPHLLLDRVKGELKQALDKADAKCELTVFPGTEHAFCFPERAVYDTLAAEKTWAKIFAMWDRCLKSSYPIDNGPPADNKPAVWTT